MRRDTWRDVARPIIAETIERIGRNDQRKLRAALRDAYPFGQRRWFPYKVWCDEVRAQLGIKQKKKLAEQRRLDQANGYQSLFSEEKDFNE
ncbi:MAG: hypothetical protein U0941_29930 [Planctomycetaceae bacterium]